jgi:transcriptional regulator GlxA family with amidase domain
LPLSAQQVEATPFNALIRPCFPRRALLFRSIQSKPTQSNVPADLTLATDFSLCSLFALHHAEPATVDAMVSRAKLGPRAFLHRFRNATGLKPNEYVQHVRMAKAHEALKFSKQSVKEIAWKVVCEDPGDFRKIFNWNCWIIAGRISRALRHC